jgi:hypothetical protein
MSTNSSESSKNIELFEIICSIFNRYIPLIYFPIGNLLNILTFTRPSLRTNSCTAFLLYSSIANIFHLTFGLITIDQYHFDIEGLSLTFCKLKYYIMYISASLSLYFVLLASINRYYQSKSNSRQWCCIQLFSPYRIFFSCYYLEFINTMFYAFVRFLLYNFEYERIHKIQHKVQ